MKDYCQFSHIPVLKKQAWTTIHQRIMEAPLSHLKKMNMMFDRDMPTITTFCRYCPSTKTMITWSSAGKHGRLFLAVADMCIKCHGRDIRVNTQEGARICAGCGLVCGQDSYSQHSSYQQSYHSMASNTRTQQKVPRVYSSSSYKRSNLFKEYLRRIQGKERNKITATDVHVIRTEIEKRNISIDALDHVILREILKHTRMQKLYNHLFFLLKELKGYSMVELSTSHCEILMKMFMVIQEAFGKYAGPRSNMLSYYYVIRKLCEIVKWTTIADCLPYLKSPQKVLQQDKVWEKVCISVGYPFIKSVP